MCLSRTQLLPPGSSVASVFCLTAACHLARLALILLSVAATAHLQQAQDIVVGRRNLIRCSACCCWSCFQVFHLLLNALHHCPKQARDILAERRDVLQRLVGMLRCGIHSMDATMAALVLANVALHRGTMVRSPPGLSEMG